MNTKLFALMALCLVTLTACTTPKGNLEVKDGRLKIDSPQGNLNIDTAAGNVSVATPQGSVDVNNGAVNVNTPQGSVNVDASTGAVNVDTPQGSVEGSVNPENPALKVRAVDANGNEVKADFQITTETVPTSAVGGVVPPVPTTPAEPTPPAGN